MRQTLTRRPSIGQGVALIVGGVLVGALAVFLANLTHDTLFHGSPALAAQAETKSTPKAEEPAAASSMSCTLPEGKLKNAGIQVEPATVVSLPSEVVVAGMIEANPMRRVDIRPRASGIVRSVDVQPAQKVKAGEVLAMLESADVGTARLNVRARQLELSIARTEAEWKSTIASNVAAMIPELRKGTPAADLEKRFADKPLGNHRAELLAAYADLEIAIHEESKQTSFFKEKIIGEHPAFVAMHTREAAQAKFEAMLEQVKFDANQQRRIADVAVQRAEAGVIDAVKRLQILGVNDGPADPLKNLPDVTAQSIATEDLTAYPLVAPFDGTIVTVSAVFSQRAEPADVLFTLADMTTVRAVGNIPESDFAILPSLKNGTVRVTATAMPGRTLEAKVLYTSPNVDPTTRRVRLVAEIENPDDLLRLGMFVQIRIDSPHTERALTVPSAAVVEIEGRNAVFVPGEKERTFLLHYVSAGREIAGRRVVTAGLKPGDRVVSTGAFVLKSELILQNEPEED